MPPVTPYVPQQITVHLGAPDSDAQNVTVSFSDYVKNVASSEIYPTWEESALRANILAIVSFALNRVYTESPGWWMTCLTAICAALASWSHWPPNSATAPPSPARV